MESPKTTFSLRALMRCQDLKRVKSGGPVKNSSAESSRVNQTEMYQ